MNRRTIYLSFWDVELSNLPGGAFRKRRLSTEDARTMIDSARSAQTLICVAKDDLGAPYHVRSRERHEQLCAALQDQAGIEIRLRDFFGRDCANPLCLAEVDEHRCLLVVDCTYVFNDEVRAGAASGDVCGPGAASDDAVRRSGPAILSMGIAPDSIEFHLFEHVEGPAGD